MIYPMHLTKLEIGQAPLDHHGRFQPNQRTNQQWIVALQGRNGLIEQQQAFDDLANYQFVVVLRYLSRNQNRCRWLAELSRIELQPLAQDIIQACLEKMTREKCALLNQFADKGSFMGWAAQIALNMARSELRRARWHRLHSLETHSFILSQSGNNAELVVSRQELTVEINQCLAQLSDTYRIVVVRCLIYGERASEVAKDLQRTVQAVYNILNRARQELVQLLQERDVGLADLAIFTDG